MINSHWTWCTTRNHHQPSSSHHQPPAVTDYPPKIHHEDHEPTTFLNHWFTEWMVITCDNHKLTTKVISLRDFSGLSYTRSLYQTPGTMVIWCDGRSLTASFNSHLWTAMNYSSLIINHHHFGHYQPLEPAVYQPICFYCCFSRCHVLFLFETSTLPAKFIVEIASNLDRGGGFRLLKGVGKMGEADYERARALLTRACLE